MARTRAFRRRQYARRKAAWSKIVNRWNWIARDFRLAVSPMSWSREKQVGFHADTPHPCSRWCCGNKRKWFGEKTVQERKADFALDDEW